MAMIHSLPVELIAEIVHFVLSESDPYPVALHQLAQVCGHWKDIILSHPPFWAIVDVAFGERWVEWALKRVKNAPLTFVYTPQDPPRKFLEARAFVECLLRNIHRCHVLVIVPRWNDEGFPMLCATIRMVLQARSLALHSFVLSTRQSAWDGPLPADNLRQVACTNQQTRLLAISPSMLQGNPLLTSNLTHLELFAGPNRTDLDRSLHVEMLADILHQCPTLISLRLSSIEIAGLLSSMLPTRHLPKLKELELDALSMDTVLALLRVIDALSCDKLHISTKSLVNEGPERVHSLLDAPIVRTVCANINKPSNVFDTLQARIASMVPDQITVSLVSSDLSNKFHITLQEVEDKLLAFQQIFSLLPDSVFSAHKLHYGIEGHSPDIHAAFIHRFPLVNSLTVAVHGLSSDDLEGLLQILTRCSLPGNEQIAWPNLESLTVITPLNLLWSITFQTRPLLDFLEARVGVLSTGSTGPRKFKKLHFKGTCEGLDQFDCTKFVEELIIGGR
ncbi:hypothetical protein FRB99_004865 [Tulasnella sp. 403]|nr:hypothetical protein FRB99_004865 [Tulasnella sp. 403]